MKFLLTKRPNGTYLISKFKPIICRVYGTKYDDVYNQAGEPAGTFVCPLVMKLAGGEDIEVYETIPIEITIKRL